MTEDTKTRKMIGTDAADRFEELSHHLVKAAAALREAPAGSFFRPMELAARVLPLGSSNKEQGALASQLRRLAVLQGVEG